MVQHLGHQTALKVKDERDASGPPKETQGPRQTDTKQCAFVEVGMDHLGRAARKLQRGRQGRRREQSI